MQAHGCAVTVVSSFLFPLVQLQMDMTRTCSRRIVCIAATYQISRTERMNKCQRYSPIPKSAYELIS